MMRRRTRGASALGVALAFVLVAALAPSAVSAVGTTYTVDADFDQGTMVGVEHDTVHDQLKLSETAVALPFIWVPNLDGSVSKIDTVTGRELARYWTAPASVAAYASPSRTTVDLNGNCWVGNRQIGTVVQIGLVENGQWDDRNGNGVCDTSADTNSDGIISAAEMLPWGQDEAVLHEVLLVHGSEATYVPGTPGVPYVSNYWSPGPRGLAVDRDNNLWCGCYGTGRYYHIDGDSGAILSNVDAGPIHGPYGAVIDGNGVLWSAGFTGGGRGTNNILRLDPSTSPPTVQLIPSSAWVYGLAIDTTGHLYSTSYSDGWVRKYDVSSGTLLASWYDSQFISAKGICATPDGDLWLACQDTFRVVRVDSTTGAVKALIPGLTQPTGVSVDAAGKVWVVCQNGVAARIDPATNAVDHSRNLGVGHYGYSDMTGYVARNITTKKGSWSVVHDSGRAGTTWTTTAWTADVPVDTLLTVEVRTSADGITYGAWVPAVNGGTLSVAAGRYCEARVNFQINAGEVSPILYDFTLSHNEPPTMAVDNPSVSVDEGSMATNSGALVDPDGDALTVSASLGSVTYDAISGTWSWQYTPADNIAAPVAVVLSADDGNGGTATTSFWLAVANVAPDAGAITPSAYLVPIGAPVSASVPFTDPGILDTHTCVWDWQDGTSAGVVTESGGNGSASGEHTYLLPGVYQISATVTDKDGASDTSVCSEYVVVYDPTAGFVTGGGWIQSLAGSYAADPELAGRANFGFVSKYKKGASIPEGSTEFQFRDGDVSFHSSVQQWLVINQAGANAQFKCAGTVNGALAPSGGPYQCMIWAGDGNGLDGADTFRIKVWYEDAGGAEIVIYDNGAAQAIEGGSIVLHAN